MTTDIMIYGIIFGVTLLFGILGLYDRLFGIVGALIGFIGGLYILNNGDSIVTQASYSTGCSCWVSNIASVTDTITLMILLGLTVAIDAILIIRKTR